MRHLYPLTFPFSFISYFTVDKNIIGTTKKREKNDGATAIKLLFFFQYYQSNIRLFSLLFAIAFKCVCKTATTIAVAIIGIAILEKYIFTIIISHFGGTNNFLADFISYFLDINHLFRP